MQTVENSCFHCNSECVELIWFKDKKFCCEGCRSVYQILNENSLDKYYQLNQNPGQKNEYSRNDKFRFLELEDIRKKLVLFSSDEISRVRFSLPQIHCSSCLWLLERLNKLHEGVIQSEVYFTDREAEITFNEQKISLKELAELLTNIGYEPNISLEAYDKSKTKNYDRKLVQKIGLVGFCFGNIMLMSFPEYTGIDEQFSGFQHTFNYLNLIFSIPVLVFGAKDYIVSSFKALRAKSVNIDVPIVIGIFALYFRSLYEVISGAGAGYFDSFAGLIFFLLIGKWFQRKSYDAINFERDYRSYFPIATSKIEGDQEEIIALNKVNIGDRLLIRSNEMIPADAILLKGNGRIDYSFVSGESEPIKKAEGELLYAGGKQQGPAIEVEVVNDVQNSYLTRLWNNPIFHKKKSFKSVSDVLSKYFTIAVITIALVVGGVWLSIDPQKAPFVVTSILIVACPCAIALSIPFTHGNLLRRLASKDLFLRSSDAVEPIQEITDIVFDKTGTLTISDQVKVSWEGAQLTSEERNVIRSIVNQSAHPLSRSLSTYLSGSDLIELIDFEEIPGKGLYATVEGVEWKIGSANWLDIPNESDQTQVNVTRNGEYLGRFEFTNSYREGIDEIISKLEGEYQLHLLSGDQDKEEAHLRNIFGDEVKMLFNCSPEDKLNYIADIQEKGHKVMMVGDGLNDAGAIKQADSGIAIVDDIYAFSPSSDGILSGSKLRFLDRYLHYIKYARKVVLYSYIFSIIYNSIGLYFAISGQLTPLIAAILMPLSSISILIFVTVLTNLGSKKILSQLG